jgi:tetratricopeptide (TPR) repeat protein
MKQFALITISLFLSLQLSAQDSFKDKYEQAFIHLSNESYQRALPILLEMEEMDKKNSNTLFSIGNCYMHTTYNKELSIPYFERILENYKNLTIDYKIGSHKEKQAPIATFQLLGQAYHYNYQFDLALEKYGEYKDVLDPQNFQDNKSVDRDIQITKNAMQLQSSPIDMKIKGITKINSEYAEYRPKVTGDESTMFFTSRRKKQ